jgi:8-oxo-dGTP pyrophosphatase MutT (NUDIX family)
VIGAAVAVWRRSEIGVEWLVLHRSHFAPDFAGDWAWGPPGGECRQGEPAADCARRELREETGVDAPCAATDCGRADFAMFGCEVDGTMEIRLSPEHDAYRWLPLDEACALCLPSYVGDQLACVAATIGQR